MTTLSELNSCDAATFIDRLRGIYEHSPWIPERAAAQRPFVNATALKLALQSVVSAAALDEQLGLIRAHPELAGKAAVGGQLTRNRPASKPNPACTCAAPRNSPCCTG
jgi:N-carbamoyl-L-amino-acid hydrolase